MITLDEFKKQVDDAANAYGATVMAALEKAVEAELDGNVCIVIIEQSFLKMSDRISK